MGPYIRSTASTTISQNIVSKILQHVIATKITISSGSNNSSLSSLCICNERFEVANALHSKILRFIRFRRLSSDPVPTSQVTEPVIRRKEEVFLDIDLLPIRQVHQNSRRDATRGLFFDRIEIVAIMLQSKLISQTILKHTDYFLSLVEKCIEWSLPEQNSEDEKESGTTELVRPLPWLLFLPCLMILRLIRVIVNIGAFLFNYPKITSSEMIKFVQKRRRYLHDAMKNDKKERYKVRCAFFASSECNNKDNKINTIIVLMMGIGQKIVNERGSMKKALIRSICLTLSSLSCLNISKPPSLPPKIYINSNLDFDPINKMVSYPVQT
ncbi:PREDICTED: uncharacterized protein LOC108747890 [Trachymyrmex septentrionalis]|uniref:uncharacterized protein LOC108747890 n=1 Tax=Trachymyrmex septentrionalis TaxID=34720 RepID=UPI00084F8318|nr:PREDICTED: uncharacterized protein LOC108747890 [Trachymyrmex septentrionalis]